MEETWFDEWDHKIPWENADLEKWSPRKHAAKLKTLNLISHNPLDSRVPITPGLMPMRVEDETNTGFL